MTKPLDPAKFRDPHLTAKGEPRAHVGLERLDVLWFNTGTLCNITCRHCYIDSSPTNDRLTYLSLSDVAQFLDELDATGQRPREIGFTGGEPFMNPDIIAILDQTLARGHQALVLTNAMRPMRRHDGALLDLKARYGAKLMFRVSLDHPTQARHDAERGDGSFAKTCDGITFLSDHGFRIAIAGRAAFATAGPDPRAAYQALAGTNGWRIDADDQSQLVLFPEMDVRGDVPEITTACWGILNKNPSDVMCATARMVIKRKGAAAPVVVACTLIVDDPAFELGANLREAARDVSLNHPHCATFCVLGGASCSA
jgi:hypothetical protein